MLVSFTSRAHILVNITDVDERDNTLQLQKTQIHTGVRSYSLFHTERTLKMAAYKICSMFVVFGMNINNIYTGKMIVYSKHTQTGDRKCQTEK